MTDSVPGYHIGTMGYGYADWQDGVFYPAGMPSRNFLAHYATIFDAVEMDSTFYGTPQLAVVRRWVHAVSGSFVFCPKVPRTITHEARMQAGAWSQMEEFLSIMRHFGHHLGPILIQLPPDFSSAERASLDAFLPKLPDDLRFVVEFRHPSWYHRSTSDMLHSLDIGWASTDYIHMPKQIHVTTDFAYLRLLGRHGRFQKKVEEVVDSTPRLQWWCQQLEPHLPMLQDVHVFANNDYAGHAPTTATRLKQILNLPFVPTRPPQQASLL